MWGKRTFVALVLAGAWMMTPHTAAGQYFNVPETLGVITDASNGYLHVQGEPLTEYALEDIWVRVGDAPIFDLLTGYPANADDIIPGLWVRVAYAPAWGQPEPVTADAVVVWLNFGMEGSAAFKAVVSENIQYDADACTFATADGKYRVTLTEDTLITDADDSYIHPTDIQPGMAMFVWVDMITASAPAQAYPERAMLIHPALTLSTPDVDGIQ